jgi:hypothetical protein
MRLITSATQTKGQATLLHSVSATIGIMRVLARIFVVMVRTCIARADRHTRRGHRFAGCEIASMADLVTLMCRSRPRVVGMAKGAKHHADVRRAAIDGRVTRVVRAAVVVVFDGAIRQTAVIRSRNAERDTLGSTFVTHLARPRVSEVMANRDWPRSNIHRMTRLDDGRAALTRTHVPCVTRIIVRRSASQAQTKHHETRQESMSHAVLLR